MIITMNNTKTKNILDKTLEEFWLVYFLMIPITKIIKEILHIISKIKFKIRLFEKEEMEKNTLNNTSLSVIPKIILVIKSNRVTVL